MKTGGLLIVFPSTINIHISRCLSNQVNGGVAELFSLWSSLQDLVASLSVSLKQQASVPLKNHSMNKMNVCKMVKYFWNTV